MHNYTRDRRRCAPIKLFLRYIVVALIPAIVIIHWGVLPKHVHKSSSFAQHDLIFTQLGEMRDDQLIVLLHARYFHPTAEISLLIHYSNTEQPGSFQAAHRDVLVDAGIRMYFYNADNSTKDHQRLQACYVHSSTNPPEFERFCLARFISLHHFCETHSIMSMIHIDLDIVPFTDLFELAGHSPWSLNKHSSYFVHWNAAALAEFANSILAFYCRSNRTELYMDISRFGNDFRDSVLASSGYARLQAELQEFWPDNIPKQQFSDMNLFISFVVSNSNTPFQHANSSELEQSLKVASDIHAVREDVCNNMETLRQTFSWQVMDDKLLPFFYSNNMSVPALHFQGDCKKLICPALCSNLLEKHRAKVMCCSQ